MRLADLLAGRLYVDTNVLYMHLRTDAAHAEAVAAFFTRVVRGAIEAFVGVPTADELLYRLLLGRIRDSGIQRPIEALRRDAAAMIAAHADPVATAIRKLLALPNIRVVGVDGSDLERMLTNITAFGILPRDGLNIAICQRLGLSDIASDDTDFDRVPFLSRHWVTNPPCSTP